MKIRNVANLFFTALALAAVPAANAAPSLSFTVDGGLTVICPDGGVCDLNGAPGVVTFIGAVGAFDINVTTGVGAGVSPTFLMDLNSINLQTGGGAHSLVIGLSDTGFTQLGQINGVWGGTLSGLGTVSASAFAGAGNTLFENGMALGSLGPFAGPLVGGTFSGASPAAGPYSLSQYLTISTTGATSYSGDFELKIPEPSVLALAGIALFGAGVASRRRRT